MKKKVLVTGGLGYIGSHTVVRLVESGYDPIIVDDLSNSFITVLDGIEKICGRRPTFEHIDLKDPTLVTHLFEKYPDISGCIHFAAYKSVNESVASPLTYYQNNLISMLNLISHFERLDRHVSFIFSSSCTVYGDSDQMPLTEQSPILPAKSPYGNTKQIGEEMIKDISLAHKEDQENKTCFVSLRYFNPVGAHPSAHIGELPIGVPQNLVPFITQTAAGWRDSLSVFGSDYPTRDGTCVRDYIHVLDLADAHVAALGYIDQHRLPYDVFNVGTGEGTTVLEVIQAFEQSTRQSLAYSLTERRPGDVTQAYADTTKINTKLGWQPRYTLHDSMKTAWEWQKQLKRPTT